MKTISDYLDAYRVAKKLPSDYAAAHVLGLTKQTVSKYRHNKGAFDLDIAWRIAEATGTDVAEIIAAGEIARANIAHDATRAQLWTSRLRQMGAAMLLIVVGFLGSVTPAQAPPASDKMAQSVYYVKSILRLRRRRSRPSTRPARLPRWPLFRHFLDLFAIPMGVHYAESV